MGIFLISIFIIVFSLCVYLLLKDYFELKENNEAIEELIDDAIQDNPVTEEITIDWEHLKSINPDIIGWIEIKDTTINYPILQDNNNLFYLKHSYDKRYNSNGSIFTTNTNPFIDEETILYGHNMKNGTMFSILGKYLDADFLNSHLNFKIYTPTINYDCNIFAAYSIGIEKDNNNIKQLNFDERIEYYKNTSKYTLNTIDNPTKIVKLSTCSYINARTRPTNQRYYIIASITPTE